jgi:hypothetical protein
MTGKENESMTFHNENAVLQIARWAKVVGWTIAVIYLLSFVNDMTQMAASGGLAQMPAEIMGKLLFIANILYPIAIGAFYFLLMHGLAQGLYVALDLFITTEDEEEGIAS